MAAQHPFDVGGGNHYRHCSTIDSWYNGSFRPDGRPSCQFRIGVLSSLTITPCRFFALGDTASLLNASRRYQRKRRGPSAAPSNAVIRMPSEYQIATKAADDSGQARE